MAKYKVYVHSKTFIISVIIFNFSSPGVRLVRERSSLNKRRDVTEFPFRIFVTGAIVATSKDALIKCLPQNLSVHAGPEF